MRGHVVRSRIEAAFRGKDVALVHVTPNLVDELWGDDQPARPSNPLMVHPLKFTGRSIGDKLAMVSVRVWTWVGVGVRARRGRGGA